MDARGYGNTTQIQRCLDRLRVGSDSTRQEAREELLTYSCGRLRRLAHRLLQGFPEVRRHEDTDDVLQNALIKLGRALDVLPPRKSVAEFIGLAALQVRRVLWDLAKYYRRRPWMRNLKRIADDQSSSGVSQREPADDAAGPSTLAGCLEFLQLAEKLEPDLRQVFDLHYVFGCPHAHVAEILHVSRTEARKRWRKAQLWLYDATHLQPPGQKREHP
jgi:RNA polymerase sigma factor (sigma-70 family)